MRSWKRIIGIVLMLAIMTVTACMKAAEKARSVDMMTPMSMSAEEKAQVMGGEAADMVQLAQAPMDEMGDATASIPVRSRKIIYEATLRLEVEDLEIAIEEVEAVVRSKEGYISSLSHSASGSYPRAEITIRVPAGHFEDALEVLSRHGEVQNKQIQSQDVTAEWVDVEARIRNLKREEERLLELLQKAGKVSELLEVERELARVRGGVEAAEGRMRVLSDLVGLSTIRLTLQLPGNEPVDSWSMKAVWADGRRLFVILWRGAFTLVVNLAMLVPFLALIGVVLWGVGRLVGGQRARRGSG